MFTIHRRKPAAATGQTLVIFALAIVAIVAMVGLVVDGGNAFAQQRRAQNGIDAAAEAGTVQLARRMMGVEPTNTAAQWDALVLSSVTNTATVNGLTAVGTPDYVDIDGNILAPVGTGSIPTDAAGVHAGGTRDFRTYLAGVVGMNQFTAAVEATAITGYLESVSANGLMPLTFPVLFTQCETGGGSNRLVNPLIGNPPGHDWPTGPSNLVALPFCSNGPGNVGWIDWTPPNGGANEVADSITNPSSGEVFSSHWYFVTETGAITSLDDEMDYWEGRDIQLPIFEVVPDDPLTAFDESLLGTCRDEPNEPKDDLTDCPTGSNGGTGQNQWYFFVTFAKFHLVDSFISGNHQTECNDSIRLVAPATSGSGNQINNCLIGYFKDPVIAGPGQVSSGPPQSNFTPFGVQLIK